MFDKDLEKNNNVELEKNTNMDSNFIQRMVEEDIEEKVFIRSITTRFPPEPNGYLHIGSTYAINISHTIAKKYDGNFNLRFDDTNPLKEDMEYVNSIIEDMKWMGYDPEDRIFFGSDYSDEIFNFAVELIKKGKAYVCDLSPEEIRKYRGTLTEGGVDSPYRNRSIEENLEIFYKMRDGEFPSGAKVLRAKIDMSAPNINFRDPVIYRIHHANHYRTGDKWCIYPMYDFAHPLQDAIEGVTHSLCSAEFKDHRPLYEWFLKELDFVEPPRQREFARLNLTGVVTSKRYLRELVFNNYVDGWDDPRLPTIKGLRRRGFTPESIKAFLGEIGVGKSESTVDISMLEKTLRDDLKAKVNSLMCVLNPLKVIITNYPEDKVEELEIQNNAENPELGSRTVPFSRVIYIEKDDFMEEPIKGFHRLSPDKEVRLKGAYFIKCGKVLKNEDGEIIELHCTYDAATKSGSGFEGRKVKGTIHWISDKFGVEAEVRLYDKLLLEEEILKDDSKSWDEKLNPTSMVVLKNALVDPALKEAPSESKYQFIRHGYFTIDAKHSSKEHLIINRIVSLKDSWKNREKQK